MAIIGLTHPVTAQTSDQKSSLITISVQNVPMKEVFAMIEQQCDYSFIYRNDILDASHLVSLNVTKQTIENTLKILFAGTQNTWEISGHQIVIGKASATENGNKEKNTKLSRVTGTIRAANGELLIGATVWSKTRPTVGTASDINGKYLLDVYPDEVLEFSYVGYKSQDVPVSGRGIIDVELQPNDAILDAVEVVGYGVQKKNQRHRIAADHQSRGPQNPRCQPHPRSHRPRLGSGIGTAYKRAGIRRRRDIHTRYIDPDGKHEHAPNAR